MTRARLAALVVLCLLASACESLVEIRVQDIDLEPVDAFAQTIVYAADGSEIATFRFEHREPVEREDLPDVLVDAVVAAEDRRFWDHPGIDPRAIVRAWVANREAGEIVQGGSTITQQLIKITYFPDPENTLERKAIEAHLAWQLEQTATKDEILTDYLNTVYFGSGAYGIEAAARTYFGVTTSELTLPQAALLAGLIRSPETTSPYRDPDLAVAERRRVLDDMVEVGAITREERDAVAVAPLGVVPPPEPPPTRFPYFVEYVKRHLIGDERFGYDEESRWRQLYGGGLRIHTTIDPVLQAHAEQAAHELFSSASDPEVAIAVVRPATGEVVATVGGRDFATSQFDLATQAHRQPGSTFKVFALAAALSRGWRLDDTIESGPGTFDVGGEPWVVRSATSGPLTLREALVRSSNGAFARLGLELGPGAVEGMAHAMGVTSEIGSNPAIVLGGLTHGVSPLEMAGAFATLANGGVHVPPTPIARITDADGEVLWEPRRSPRVALDPATAWLVTDTLREAVERGTGQAARLDRPAAGKTGTVQDHTDAWFVGFTPELAAAVWMGYPDAPRPLVNIRGIPAVQGGDWPARIWRTFMTAALAGEPPRDFPYPDSLVETVLVDPLTGGLATPWCPVTEELTGLPGELPTFTCPVHTGPPPLGGDRATEPATPTTAPSAPPTAAPPLPAPTVTVPPPTTTPTPTPTPTPSPTPTPTPSAIPPGSVPEPPLGPVIVPGG